MERLSFASKFSYSATEAAIHLARYELAIPYCKGKRVLDVACGEGYGAYVLKQYGASTVEAVDNSPQAIASAEGLFARSGVRFHLHDAENVDALFAGEIFDVIVSLETIEHLRDPQRFLRALKSISSDQTIIVITCPNDHWYYSESQSSPFHRSKYTYEEFRQLTESTLGPATTWAYGVPVLGFGTTTDDLTSAKETTTGQIAMLDFQVQAAGIIVPPRGFSNVGPRNCSYFVGVWGGEQKLVYTSAVAPVSMDYYANLSTWNTAQISLTALNTELAQLRHDKEVLEATIAQKKFAQDADLQATAARLRTEIEDRQAIVAALRAQIEERQAATDREKERAAAVQAGLELLTSDHEKMRVQVLALTKELQITAEQMERRAREKDAAAEELARSHQSMAAERAQIAAERIRGDQARDQLQSTIDALKDQLARQQDQIGQIDEISATANSHRVQAFALTREFELLGAQVSTLRLDNERHMAEKALLDARVAAISEQLSLALQEPQALQAQLRQSAEEIDCLLKDNARKDGLRYIVGILPGLIWHRAIARLKGWTRAGGRRIKPLLPAPALNAARRVARALGL